MKACLAACFLLLLSLAASAFGQGARQPGRFDFYLLTLSWAPEFCHDHADSPECSGARHYGLVVHGLWPQYRDGNYPENCSTEPGLRYPSGMLDIMPDPKLVQHEWATHGTCSGLNADSYFSLIRRAFSTIKIPVQFAEPRTAAQATPLQIKHVFEKANPGLASSNIVLSCSGYYLKAVGICMTKDLRPTPCEAVRDCNARMIKIPPVH